MKPIEKGTNRVVNNLKYQNSDLVALPSKSTYFSKHVLIDLIKAFSTLRLLASEPVAIIALFVASKGFSILYLFLLADLLCCSAVFTVFYGFYQKKFKEKIAFISILLGLFLGLLFFPSPDFSKSILVGTLLPFDLFPQIVSGSLLFWSFLLATVGPAIVIISNDSIKG